MKNINRNSNKLFNDMISCDNIEEYKALSGNVYSTITASTSSIYLLSRMLPKLNNINELKRDHLINNNDYALFSDNYLVSKDGKIFNLKLKKYVNPTKHKLGYLQVNINNKTELLHRVVWIAFNGEIPEGKEINHIDCNRSNCNLSNLEILTHKENCNVFQSLINYKKSSYQKRKEILKNKNYFKRKKVIQLDFENNIVNVWSSIGEIKRELGFYGNYICSCCKGKKIQYKGFYWHYADE